MSSVEIGKSEPQFPAITIGKSGNSESGCAYPDYHLITVYLFIIIEINRYHYCKEAEPVAGSGLLVGLHVDPDKIIRKKCYRRIQRGAGNSDPHPVSFLELDIFEI